LAQCEKRLTQVEELWDAHKYSEAYLEAHRAVRPLRLLQRACWDEAIKDLTPTGLVVTRGAPPDGADTLPRKPTPHTMQSPSITTAVSSPYAVSFYTLPRHWAFMEQIRAAKPGENVLPGGDFEAPPGDWPSAWLPQAVTLPSDDVELSAERVTEDAQEGRQCLRLRIKPKDPLHAPAALERTFLAVHTPAVRLTPGGPARHQ